MIDKSRFKPEWMMTTVECAAHGLLAIVGMKGLVTKETVYKIQEVTAIAAQRKLLGYLIADAKNINDHNLYPIIGKVQLESMLKQLEENK